MWVTARSTHFTLTDGPLSGNVRVSQLTPSHTHNDDIGLEVNLAWSTHGKHFSVPNAEFNLRWIMFTLRQSGYRTNLSFGRNSVNQPSGWGVSE